MPSACSRFSLIIQPTVGWGENRRETVRFAQKHKTQICCCSRRTRIRYTQYTPISWSCKSSIRHTHALFGYTIFQGENTSIVTILRPETTQRVCVCACAPKTLSHLFLKINSIFNLVSVISPTHACALFATWMRPYSVYVRACVVVTVCKGQTTTSSNWIRCV